MAVGFLNKYVQRYRRYRMETIWKQTETIKKYNTSKTSTISYKPKVMLVEIMIDMYLEN